MAWIESLPPWYFVAGDNAYVCTEHLLTPFMGCSCLNPENDSFNFLLSQLRVCFEMAFGRLVTKWRTLCSSLEVPLAKSGYVFQACCILHNYCIDEEIIGKAATPAGDHLFKVRDDGRKLNEEQVDAFHRTVYQLLFEAKLSSLIICIIQALV